MIGKRQGLAAARGILAGLVLFFAVESAVARRVGVDLFIPAAGGAFLPCRLLRLILFLALCLFAALRGRPVFDRLNRACDRDGVRWLVSSTVTALFFVWAARVTVLSYSISDDITVIQAIAAIPAHGYDLAARTFSSDLFCAFLGLFYRLDPDGYWYFGYEVGMQLLALAVIGRCILLRVRCRSGSALTGCLLHAVLCAGLFLYPFAAITFTLTAAMAGTAAVALMLCRDAAATRLGRAASDVGSGLLLLLCWLQRDGSGKALLCFWTLALVYQLVKTNCSHDRRRVMRCGALGATAVVTVAVIFLCGRVKLAEVEPEYEHAESIRSLIVDYLIDELEPEHFEAAGFSPELAALTRDWFFMDEHVTAESFWALAEAYYASASPAGGGEQAAGLFSSLVRNITADAQMSAAACAAAALSLLAVALYVRVGTKSWLDVLTAMCAAGGALVLSLYLLRQGYFPARAFLVIMYPTIVTMVLTLLAVPKVAAGISRSCRAMTGCVCAVALAALAAACVFGVSSTPHATERVTRKDLFTEQWQIDAYARMHEDTIIINNAYFDVFDPLHSADYPENLVWWGNCGDLSKPTEERLYADDFFRDDVQFLGDGFSTLLYLLQYLTVDYGPVQASVVTQMSRDIYVVDLDRISPADNLTGWYTQNGMTYYFADGVALTGEQTIDGEICTFSPPGVDAQLVTIPCERLIYTTDAYTLRGNNP